MACPADGSQDTLEHQRVAQSIHQDTSGGSSASLISGNDADETVQPAASRTLQSIGAADEANTSDSSQHPSPCRYTVHTGHLAHHPTLGPQVMDS